MAGKKVQVVMLLEPENALRLDALRIVTRESRARVAEMALTGEALRGLELRYTRELTKVVRLAKRAGVKYEDYVKAYARAYSRATYGPGVEALEEDDGAVRAALA